ncbi:MAG: hypothetical protein U0270_30165 [Labilithrix sp.]
MLVTVRGLRPVRIEAASLLGGRLAGGECILCVTDESQRREVEAKRMQSQARVAEADRIQSLGTLSQQMLSYAGQSPIRFARLDLDWPSCKTGTQRSPPSCSI